MDPLPVLTDASMRTLGNRPSCVSAPQIRRFRSKSFAVITVTSIAQLA
jgi:hypothetical protein